MAMRNVIRDLVLVVVLLGVANMAPHANTTPSATQTLSQLSSGMTGIYRLAYLKGSGRRKETLALVHQGRIVEVHTRTAVARAYSRRQVQVRPADTKELSGETFNQLIVLAGGVNKNVAVATSSVQQSFLQTAGLGNVNGNGAPPLVVPPQDGQCPPAYEPHMTFQDGHKQLDCRLTSEAPPSLSDRVAVWWEDLDLVSSARAFLLWKWTMEAATSVQRWGFTYTDNWGNTGLTSWEFNGFGFQIAYLDTPG